MSKKSDFAIKLEKDKNKKTFKEWHPSKNRMKGHSWPTGTIFGLDQDHMYELKENNRWHKCKPTKNTEKKTTKKKTTKKKTTKKKTTKKKTTKKNPKNKKKLDKKGDLRFVRFKIAKKGGNEEEDEGLKEFSNNLGRMTQEQFVKLQLGVE